jgi:hypothetical protein
MSTELFAAGGYRYIPGVFQYSAGVAAEPGFAIERVRFAQPVPLAEGFAAAEARLAALGRPMTAFAACELRSPEPFSEQGFVDFNRLYVGTLERWGIYENERNPVARTNVCPERHKPDVVSMYAFSYTVPAADARPSFIVAGSGETQEGKGEYRNTIVRYRDISADAMREKTRYVLNVMEARLAALGFGWADAGSTQVYTVHDIGWLIDEEFAQRGAGKNGVNWHFVRPPVVDIEFEMDVRGAWREVAL